MKTQHQNVHLYLKEILNIPLQRNSGDFMNTKDRHHMDFISLHANRPNVCTHAHIQTVVKYAFSESEFASLAWL